MLDILNGSAVRAVAGNRADYRPLIDGADPEGRIRQLRQRFNCDQFYLADLDAIVFRHPQRKLWRDLAAVCGQLWLDPGICTTAMLADLKLAGNVTPIVGSETAVALDMLLQDSAYSDLIFSLDLCQGTPIAADPSWQGLSSIQFARQLVHRGAKN